MTDRNLIVVINPTLLDPRDFQEIAENILSRRKRIHVYLFAHDYDYTNDRRIDWRLPTLTVSLAPDMRAVPKRGPIFFNRQIDKIEQIEIMKKAGIRVPSTQPYHKEVIYDPDERGDFVIIKSSGLAGSSSGYTAYITPTRYLNEPEKFDDPVRSILLSGNAIVQEFIQTGRNPTNHRACVFLGRVLYLMKVYSTFELPELDPHSRQTHLYDSNLVDPDRGIKRQIEMVVNPEMIELSQKIAKIFPGIPLLGLDLQRNENTGDLYPLEINAGGNTWHFSSPSTVEGRKLVTREDRINQFGAWDIAASALIEKTLYYAK